ncbi:MAG: hypothetical protein Q9218_001891 [Villophora microphyllina]
MVPSPPPHPLRLPQLAAQSTVGCCHSTPSQSNPSSSSPYLPSSSHAAITHADSSSALQPIHPTISRAQQSTHSRSHRTLRPDEHFNAPLRPHVHKPITSSATSRHRTQQPPRTWTRTQLQKERTDFFETRVTGRSEVWGCLKLVVELLGEGKVEEAQGLLDACALTVPTGDLVEGCYDEGGELYMLPGWVVAEPEVVEDEDIGGGTAKAESDERLMEDEKVKNVVVDTGEVREGGNVKVRCRLSDRGGADVVVAMGRRESVKILVKRLEEGVKVTFRDYDRFNHGQTLTPNE